MWPFKKTPNPEISDHVASLLRVMSDPTGWEKSYDTVSKKLRLSRDNVSVYPNGQFGGAKHPEISVWLPDERAASSPQFTMTECRLIFEASQELSRNLTDIAILRQQEIDRLALEKLKAMEPSTQTEGETG